MARYILLAAIIYLMHTKGLHVDAFSFANSYASDMVLHAAPKSAIIWGMADRRFIGREVKVIVTLNVKPVQSQPVTGVIMPDAWGEGTWRVVLPQYPAGGPYTVTALLDRQNIQLRNVLFGEVWICSGALNMEMETFKTFNGTEEISGANTYGNIRFLTMRDRSLVPLDDIRIPVQQWTQPSSNSVGQFSSVCWTFGRKLHEHTGKPIGLIAMVQRQVIQSWLAPDALAECDNNIVNSPSQAWNAMVHPFLNMTITGAISYQGERNANEFILSEDYECILPAMIRDWRRRFLASTGQTDALFPFGIVQIGGRLEERDAYPSIRWKQTAERAKVPNKQLPNTFMAVAMDLPDFESPWGPVLFRDKTTVAERLMLGVRATHLKEKDVEGTGPVPIGYRFSPTAFTLELQYDNASQLEIRSNDGFEVCCSKTLRSLCELYDRRWVKAPVLKSDNTTITLSTSACQAEHLLGQRYAWRQTPCAYRKCAVYSATSGLPAHMYKTAGRIKDDGVWHPMKF